MSKSDIVKVLFALEIYGNMLLGVTEYRVEPPGFYVFTS